MDNNQFSQAVAMARSDIELDQYDTDILMGFGLPDFKQVSVILEVAAACIRWQCAQFDGGWDNEAMEECRNAFRHKVLIMGSDHIILPKKKEQTNVC
tara:strand:- start:565 stop:855 length:291 start_codon:yes stop_codon:yes gene_type:complete